MEKMLIVILGNGTESVLGNVLSFTDKEKHINRVNAFQTNGLLQYGNLEIVPERRNVKLSGNYIELTNYEFEILYLLAKNPGQVFSRGQIYNQIWGMTYVGAENNVSSLIYRIRKKIEPKPSKPIYILTVWGIRYKFNDRSKALNSQKFSQLISKSISSCLAGICLLEIIFVMVNRSCSAIKWNKWIWKYFIILASDIT